MSVCLSPFQDIPFADVSMDFRVYWTPDYIVGYIDGERPFEFTNEGMGSDVWPFD